MQSPNYNFRKLDKDSNFDNDLLPSEAMSFYWDKEKQYVYLEDLIDGYQTLQVTGREILPYKVTEETPPGMDGSLLESVHLPTRDIDIKYRLLSEDANDFRQKYNKLMFFLSNNELTFNFRDEPKYFYKGVLSGADTPDGGNLDTVSSFTLHCQSPWKFSNIKTITIDNGQSITDNYLLYSVVPESISFSLTGAGFKYTNQTQNQTFGLVNAHNNVVLTPSKGEVKVDTGLILNDIAIGSELERLTIKKGDVINITNGSAATITYRRWLL